MIGSRRAAWSDLRQLMIWLATDEAAQEPKEPAGRAAPRRSRGEPRVSVSPSGRRLAKMVGSMQMHLR